MDFKQLSAGCWVSMISVSNLPHKILLFSRYFFRGKDPGHQEILSYSHELWHVRGFSVHGSLVVCFNWWFGFRKKFPKNERHVLTKVLLYPPLKKKNTSDPNHQFFATTKKPGSLTFPWETLLG